VVGQWSIERVTLRVQHDELRAAASGLSKPVVEVERRRKRVYPLLVPCRCVHPNRVATNRDPSASVHAAVSHEVVRLGSIELRRERVRTEERILAALALLLGLVERLVAVRTPVTSSSP